MGGFSGKIRVIAAVVAVMAASFAPALPAQAAPLRGAVATLEAYDPRIAALAEGVVYGRTSAASIGQDDVADPNTYRAYVVRLDQAERKLRAIASNEAGAPSLLDSKAAAGRLEHAADVVSSSHAEKQAADEAARAAQEAREAEAARQAQAAAQEAARDAQTAQAAAPVQAPASGSYASEGDARAAAADNGATPYQGDDGVWHLQYHNDYGAANGDANGDLTQWADGYYVSHDWSENGQKITDRTEYVEVDGQTYRLAGTQEVSRDTTWEEIEGWVHQNGGIGMQTCVEGGGYLVNHYEPVG